MDHDHEVLEVQFQPVHEMPNPNCQHCGGSGWIGDIACPACS